MSTASKVRLLILVAILAFSVVFVVRMLGSRKPLEIRPGSALVVELSGRYVEAAAASPLARLAGDRTQPFIGLLSTLRLAERDPRIETVVLRIQPLQIGWAKADELRDALGRLRQKGKQTIAYLEIANFSANRELYVASAADEVWVSPGSALPLVGLAAEYLFLGGFWEKIGVDFDVAKAGRYKSAVEIYSERTMSEASRTAWTSWGVIALMTADWRRSRRRRPHALGPPGAGPPRDGLPSGGGRRCASDRCRGRG